MPPVDPVFFTAGGALFGVALTLATQVLLSRIQRRHDKQTKTFDTRLELYAEFTNTLDQWSRVGDRIRQLRHDPDVTRLTYVDDQVNKAIEALGEFVSGLQASPAPSSEQVKEFEAEAERRQEELKRLRSERDARVEEAERKVAEMAELGETLKRCHDRLIELS